MTNYSDNTLVCALSAIFVICVWRSVRLGRVRHHGILRRQVNKGMVNVQAYNWQSALEKKAYEG